MDRDGWKILKASVDRVCRRLKVKRRKLKFSYRLITLMYFWSVLHDECLSWACDRGHYGDWFRPRKLPSISQFTRRVSEEVFQAILQRVHDDLARAGFSSPVHYLDGKPLTVSAVSKDPDARRGHVTGGFAKGYKLHAVVSEGRRVLVWSVMPLNVAEQSVALEMTARLPGAPPLALTLADSNYDSAPLHKAQAACDRRLLTPLKAQQRVKDGGHHPVTLRQMGPQRREALEVWKGRPELAEYVLKQRNNVEGVFSVMAVALKMGHLPAHVRRLHRVRRWVGAKIILYNARLSAQEKAAATAAPPAREKLVA
jgi:hypothetical protein